jgi:hypothetical protein
MLVGPASYAMHENPNYEAVFAKSDVGFDAKLLEKWAVGAAVAGGWTTTGGVGRLDRLGCRPLPGVGLCQAGRRLECQAAGQWGWLGQLGQLGRLRCLCFCRALVFAKLAVHCCSPPHPRGRTAPDALYHQLPRLFHTQPT